MFWVLAFVVIGLVAAGYGVHRLALWAEERGWIYYRNKKGKPAPWLGALEAIYKPEVEHVIEEASAQEIRADQDDAGQGRPPSPGLG